MMATATAQSDNFYTLQQRYFDYYVAQVNSSTVSQVQQLMSNIQADGSWSNVNYQDTNAIQWQPLVHVNNFLSMAAVYSADHPGNNLHQSDDLLNKTLLALDFWLANSTGFSSSNWIHTELSPSVPLSAGCFLLANQTHLNETRRDLLLPILNKAALGNGTFQGAIKVLVAKINVLKSFIIQDESVTSAAFVVAWSTLTYTAGNTDGIKIDGSFFQGDPLVVNGYHGASYLNDVLTMIVLTDNTSFVAGNAGQEVFATMALQGSQWMSYSLNGGTFWHSQVVSFALGIPDGTLFSGIDPNLFWQSPLKNSEFQVWGSRINGTNTLLPSGNRQFWYSDLVVHARQNYMASLRFTSKRTINSQCQLGNGYTTQKIADGSFLLIVDGSEYFNIYPLWDWQRIPGITSEVNDTQVACSAVRAVGTTKFDGSLSDGDYGIAAMDLAPTYSTVRGKKAWFMFDDQIVFLGTNITNTLNTATLLTSIEQKFDGGNNIFTSNNSASPLPKGGINTFTNVSWVHHGQVGILFPDVYNKTNAAPVTVNVGTQGKGASWQYVGTDSKGTNGDIYSVYLSHTAGGAVQNQYQYIMFPNMMYNTFTSQLDTLAKLITVIRNDDSVQAVAHRTLNNLQMVFWKPQQTVTTPYGFKVTSQFPILIQVLMINETNYDITVSDPTQLLASNIVVFQYLELKGDFCVFDKATNYSTVTFSLPSGKFVGSSIKKHYLVLSHPVPPVSTTGANPTIGTSTTADGTMTTSTTADGTTTGLTTGTTTGTTTGSTTSPSDSTTTEKTTSSTDRLIPGMVVICILMVISLLTL
ncbi:hypothetical protein SAMD00019534_041330 [Acytostelium subglobosum LB1]|uniref:hypothetical protein n=1 Tax=Acytostelium subglobosum LB1 TaxID=1410327 RepID=UPI000644C9B2|nr:hypothetical protein SAMD00019534_041330 [Acytostelium subglobosum LB1]GAM20958.1 hypothetical protein SAMD00019534_041330 [Acytostelium subglobosum LB1]|eukprot:XP_012756092.1 hypothetical protein SAMD00019534_041330 [Acytostelium subglobosum LB1]